MKSLILLILTLLIFSLNNECYSQFIGRYNIYGSEWNMDHYIKENGNVFDTKSYDNFVLKLISESPELDSSHRNFYKIFVTFEIYDGYRAREGQTLYFYLANAEDDYTFSSEEVIVEDENFNFFWFGFIVPVGKWFIATYDSDGFATSKSTIFTVK